MVDDDGNVIQSLAQNFSEKAKSSSTNPKTGLIMMLLLLFHTYIHICMYICTEATHSFYGFGSSLYYRIHRSSAFRCSKKKVLPCQGRESSLTGLASAKFSKCDFVTKLNEQQFLYACVLI